MLGNVPLNDNLVKTNERRHRTDEPHVPRVQPAAPQIPFGQRTAGLQQIETQSNDGHEFEILFDSELKEGRAVKNMRLFVEECVENIIIPCECFFFVLGKIRITR